MKENAITLYKIIRKSKNGPIAIITYKNGKPNKLVSFQNMKRAGQYLKDHAEELYTDVFQVPGTHYIVAIGSTSGEKTKKVLKTITVEVS